MPLPSEMTRYAYTREYNGKHWVFIHTPSGDVARLLLSYDDRTMAELAMATLGYLPLPAAVAGTNDNTGE